MPCADLQLDTLVRLALEEDIGSGDRTTSITLDPQTFGKAKAIAKEPLVLAGLTPFVRVFQILSQEVEVLFLEKEGELLPKGSTVIELRGPLDVLLTGERTALNFLQHLSGIATLTSQFVSKIKQSRVILLDTRKTTPCLRALEKESVRLGGGSNHRMGLFDGILIKDNHIKACGGIRQAVEKAKACKNPLIKIEIEVTTIQELREALVSGPDMIMLDNMKIEDMKMAVDITGGSIPLEASGNITLESIEEVACTGVNYISVGAITNAAKASDISMHIILAAP
jgi:nicotinate-nucleotide pyrophosphorylase (carboxylating)